MRVHIARRHAIGGVPINNRDVRQPALGSQPIKDDISKFYYNSLLRRFLPISNNGGATYPNSHYSYSDPLQSSVNILESITELFEMRNKFLNFYTSTPESAFRYSSGSQLGSAHLFDTLGANYMQNIPAVITHKYEQTSDTLITEREIQGFRVDVCSNCLELYSISICENTGFTLEEILQQITTSIHHCGNSYSEISILSTHDKQTRYNKLVNMLKPIIMNKVRDWLQGEKACLRAFMLRANPPAGCVRFAKPVEYPFSFVNRAIEIGHTTLEESELNDFLLLSKYRSTGIYAAINSRPGSKKFPDSTTYGILITRY